MLFLHHSSILHIFHRHRQLSGVLNGYLRTNVQLATDIEQRIRLHFGLVPNVDGTPEATEAAAAEKPKEEKAVDTAETPAKGQSASGGNGAIKKRGRQAARPS